MDSRLLPLLLALPALFDALLCRGFGASWGELRARQGLRGCRPNDLLAALGLVLAGLALGALALRLLPPGQRDLLGVALRAGLGPPAPSLALWLLRCCGLALGQELLLRGWLGGVLVRALGFPRGNALQALASALLALTLLPLGAPLVALLLALFGLAWALGGLRWRSGSLLPGWLAGSLLGTLTLLV